MENVKKCIEDLENGRIDNKDEYILRLAIARLDKCNKKYMDDFDKELDKVIQNIDCIDMTKLLKCSVKLYNSVVDSCLETLCNFLKS